MVQRLFCLTLFLTPITGYGQIIENETINTVSAGFAVTLLIADDRSQEWGDVNLYRATYFRSKKPVFGSRRHRYTRVIGIDFGTASGIHASYGISQISRFHQITLSSGFRLAYVPSIFAELHILAFPLKRIGILGINVRVHQKLSKKEVIGLIGLGIIFVSYRRTK